MQTFKQIRKWVTAELVIIGTTFSLTFFLEISTTTNYRLSDICDHNFLA